MQKMTIEITYHDDLTESEFVSITNDLLTRMVAAQIEGRPIDNHGFDWNVSVRVSRKEPNEDLEAWLIKIADYQALIDITRRAERRRMWEKINSYIKKGHLDGNGFDKAAQRNGLVLATNIIWQFGI